MILSSSTILLDYIKDSSCNDSKIMQWFMIRCHACIRTWFWNIGPINLLLVHETLSSHELAFGVVCWIHFSCCLFLPIISWRRSLRLFTSSPFFSECMTCYCLLCHAFVKCFIFFKSTGSHPVLKTCKAFHEISFIAPSVECDPSLGFLKRRNSFWLKTGPLTMTFSYFKMRIVRIDKLYFYLEINLQVI